MFGADLKSVKVVNREDKDGAPCARIQVVLEADYSNHLLKALGGSVNRGPVQASVEPMQYEMLDRETGEILAAQS